MKTYYKPAVFTLSLLPLVWLSVGLIQDRLGANPIEYIIRDLGEWGLRFLLITLAITPAIRLTRWTMLAQFRRMMGLFAFFYVFLHLCVFIVLDLSGSFSALWHEILKRKFITVGMLAFAILIPLAATSFNKIIKKMGAARWKKLHKLVYLAAPLAVLHFYWMVKADKSEPIVYGTVLTILLGSRIYFFRVKKSAKVQV